MEIVVLLSAPDFEEVPFRRVGPGGAMATRTRKPEESVADRCGNEGLFRLLVEVAHCLLVSSNLLRTRHRNDVH